MQIIFDTTRSHLNGIKAMLISCVEPYTRRHVARRLFTQRATVRSGCVRHTHHLGHMAWKFFQAGIRNHSGTGPGNVMRCLNDMSQQAQLMMGTRAQERVLGQHTASRRARELEMIYEEADTEKYETMPLKNAA
jgi:hypothetical protein